MKRLVCIIPQIRYPHLTWDSFKKYVIDELDADLLLCVKDTDEENEFTKHAKFIFKKNEDDWNKMYDEMSTEWRNLKQITGLVWENGIPFGTGGIMLFYRWYLFKVLNDNKLLDKYDQIVVTRSDYKWLKPHPKLDNSYVWIPNGEFHTGITDRHIVVSSRLAEQFLATGGTVSSDQYKSTEIFYNTRRIKNIESYLYFRYNFDNIIELIRFFPQKMYLIKDNSTIAKYPSEYEDCQHDTESDIVWPWRIDFCKMRYGMFTGKAIQSN